MKCIWNAFKSHSRHQNSRFLSRPPETPKQTNRGWFVSMMYPCFSFLFSALINTFRTEALTNRFAANQFKKEVSNIKRQIKIYDRAQTYILIIVFFSFDLPTLYWDVREVSLTIWTLPLDRNRLSAVIKWNAITNKKVVHVRYYINETIQLIRITDV